MSLNMSQHERRLPLFDGSPNNWNSWKKFIMARFLIDKDQIQLILHVIEHRKISLKNTSVKLDDDLKVDEKYQRTSNEIYSLIFQCVTEKVLKVFQDVPFGDGCRA
jgi:hypothetical protein